MKLSWSAVHSYVYGTYMCPPKTHVILGAHACALFQSESCDITLPSYTMVPWYHGTLCTNTIGIVPLVHVDEGCDITL
jgi:hypothetical protein